MHSENVTIDCICNNMNSMTMYPEQGRNEEVEMINKAFGRLTRKKYT